MNQDFSLIRLIEDRGRVRLRELRVPTYSGDHPTKAKRVERLFITEDGAFIVPHAEVNRLIAEGQLVPLDNDPALGIYVTRDQEQEFEREVHEHFEAQAAIDMVTDEARFATKH